MSNRLVLKEIHKEFLDGENQRVNVLDGISLDIPSLKTIGIVGASGSGKTTLLNIIGGLERPSKGEVLHLEQNIFAKSDDELSDWRNTKVGFVFQFHQLLNDFTAIENVIMPGLIASKPQKELREKASDLLERVGVSHRLHHKPSQLSGGEQQRVAIARALINSPIFILADEPTGNLDEKNSSVINDLLLEITQENKATLVMVTHNMSIANQLDFVWTLQNHQINQKAA